MFNFLQSPHLDAKFSKDRLQFLERRVLLALLSLALVADSAKPRHTAFPDQMALPILFTE